MLIVEHKRKYLKTALMQSQKIKPFIQEKLFLLGFKLLRLATQLKYRQMMALGRFIGHRFMQLNEEQTRIAAINIGTCFPVLTPQQNRELLLQHFEHHGMGIMEMAISWWLPESNFKALIRIKGQENVETAFKRGKGIIFACAQFTTPDILIRCLGEAYPLTAIYYPNHRPFIDECIRSYRSKKLQKLLMHEDLASITQTLKANQAVLFTHDVTPSHKQIVFSKFFHVPAATNTAISRFARMTKAEVIPVTVLRRPDHEGYHLIFESPLPDFPSDNIEQDTQRLNHVIERWIDTEPAQYRWSSPRFRERPEGEPRFY